jgi:predicted nucleic acid-binding protein
MLVFFDTSVLVAGMVEPHPKHGRSRAWLERARAGEFEWAVAGHSLAETYSVLTSLPVKPRISPGGARRLIRENIESSARIVTLTSADHGSVLDRMALLGIIGGNVYDALLAGAAEKAGARRLLTLNPEDFQKAWPEGKGIITVP